MEDVEEKCRYGSHLLIGLIIADIHWNFLYTEATPTDKQTEATIAVAQEYVTLATAPKT